MEKDTAHATQLEACYEQRIGVAGKHRLRVRLRFDEQGELIAIDQLEGSLGSADAYVEEVLLGVRWEGKLAGGTVEVGLRLSI